MKKIIGFLISAILLTGCSSTFSIDDVGPKNNDILRETEEIKYEL